MKNEDFPNTPSFPAKLINNPEGYATIIVGDNILGYVQRIRLEFAKNSNTIMTIETVNPNIDITLDGIHVEKLPDEIILDFPKYRVTDVATGHEIKAKTVNIDLGGINIDKFEG